MVSPSTTLAAPALPQPPDAAATAAPSAAAATEGRYAFAALVVFTFVNFIAPQQLFPPLARLHPAALAAAAGVTAHLYERISRRLPLLSAPREVWWAVAFAGWALLGAPLSYWPGGSVSFLVDKFFKVLVLFWLITATVTTPGRLRFLIGLMVALTVPLAVTAVSHFNSQTFMAGAASVQRIVGYEGPLTENPNDLALLLNLSLPLAISLFLMARRTWVRTALAGVIALDVVAVVVTFSRAAFVVLALLGVVQLKRLFRYSAPLAAAGALAALGAGLWFMPSDYLDHLGTITDIDSDPTGSAQARWGDNQEALRLVAQNPFFGAGVGMDVLALNQARGEAWVHVHNVYLQAAVDLGLPGLALFLMVLFGCMRRAGRARRSLAASGPRDLALLATGIHTSLLAFAVAAFFSPVAYEFHFYYFAGLAVAVSEIQLQLRDTARAS